MPHNITKMNNQPALETEIKIYENWDDFKLSEELTRGIFAFGFDKPTPIQGQAIVPIITNRDIIGQAQSGSGKTGSFAIGTLQLIDLSKKTTQALVLAPTQQLAMQIVKVFKSLSIYMDGLVIKSLVGGTSVSDDANELRNNTPHIIVGTAGRVYDMMKRRNFDSGTIKLFVMDEADEMLSRGFKDQIYDIFKYFNDEVQVALFSATMPEEILTITDKFMRDPVKIILKSKDIALECINQYHIALQNDQQKYDALQDLFEAITISGQCIIYVGAVKRVVDLYEAMLADGYAVCQMHSDLTAHERIDIIEKFRSGSFRVMISSGITARGFDVQQVSTVVNFDIGRNIETYIHAVGRAGRYGRKGTAISFVTKQDMDFMHQLEKHYNIKIDELPSSFVPK